jgi:poly(A) polymerase
MFWDPLKNKLHDFVEGQQDLSQGILRAIGNPHERFLEDRLRMMRAVRYSTRFNFPIEPETLQAIVSHAPTLLPAVAMERIWQEFKKMSLFAHFDKGLMTLHRLNLLQTIFPQLKGTSVEEIQKRLAPLAFFPKKAPTITELLELFPDHTLDQLFELCDYLKLSRSERDIVRFLYHAKQMLNMPQEWQAKLEKIEWAQFYANIHAKICVEIIASHLSSDTRQSFLQEHKRRRESLEIAIHRICSQTPVVRADHLMKEGISPGKKMGVLLKEAERISVNEDIGDNQMIIDLLKKSSLWNT